MNTTTEQMVYLELDEKGLPYTIVTLHKEPYSMAGFNYYELAVSKRWGLLYHCNGLSGIVWHHAYELYQNVMMDAQGEMKDSPFSFWADSTFAVDTSQATLFTQISEIPQKYTLETIFQDGTNCHYGIVECSICDDFYPDDHMYFCTHIWRCQECNETNTPNDRCGCLLEEDERELEAIDNA